MQKFLTQLFPSPSSPPKKDLDDNQWHKVLIQRNQKETILSIDDYKKGARVPGLDFQFGDLKGNNYVFLGGMPVVYRNPENLQYLALPSIMFEKRWVGVLVFFFCTWWLEGFLQGGGEAGGCEEFRL